MLKNLIFLLIFISCSENPASSNNSRPTIVKYLPLSVGNQWTYDFNFFFNDDIGGRIESLGISEWQITNIDEDSSSIELKVNFQGSVIRYDRGEVIDSSCYSNQIVYFELEYMEENKKGYLIKNKCAGCDSNISYLNSIFNSEMLKDYKYLFIGYPDSSGNPLTKTYVEGTSSATFILEYDLNMTIGFEKLSYRNESSINIWRYNYILKDYQLN